MNDWSRAISAHEPDTSASFETVTGNRGLQIEEALIFEQDSPGHCGVDLPEPVTFRDRLGGLERQGIIGLPGLSEPQVVRHFTRLSQKNYAIDSGLYPLGSCTMKHNPRLNEKLARLPDLADIHPLQPVSTLPGTYTSDPVADRLYWAAPVSSSCRTPSATRTGGQVTVSRWGSNGTAIRFPPCA